MASRRSKTGSHRSLSFENLEEKLLLAGLDEPIDPGFPDNPVVSFDGSVTLMLTESGDYQVIPDVDPDAEGETQSVLLHRSPANLNSLTLLGGVGTDQLTIDFVNGDPIPLAGLMFEGGLPEEDNVLRLVNGWATRVRHVQPGDSTGAIHIDDSTISHMGVNTVTDDLMAVERNLEFLSTDDTVHVTDDSLPGDQRSRATNLGQHATVEFLHPSGQLTILTGDGNDEVQLGPLDAATAPYIQLDGGAGHDLLDASLLTTTASLLGNAGNDAFVVSPGQLHQIDGGEGDDSLEFVGDSLAVDLATRTASLDNLEGVGLTGSGSGRVSLTLEAVLNLADQNGVFRLSVREDDQIDLGAGWQVVGAEVDDGTFFRVLTQDAATLKLSGPHDWQNPTNSLDVFPDGEVVSQDALVVINQLNKPTFIDDDDAELFAAATLTPFPLLFYDVNGDGYAVSGDALLIINFLNDQALAEAEAESSLAKEAVDAFLDNRPSETPLENPGDTLANSAFNTGPFAAQEPKGVAGVKDRIRDAAQRNDERAPVTVGAVPLDLLDSDLEEMLALDLAETQLGRE
jgi:hypothetical protein